MHAFPESRKMSHPKFRLSALAALVAATAAACPLVAQATVPAGAAAEIISLQGTGDQRAASAADWGPARLAQALAQGDFAVSYTHLTLPTTPYV